MAQLSLHKIVKDYPGRRILRGIDLSLSSGAVALLGPNGAGKSTLLGILSTRLGASSGHFQLEAFKSTEQLNELRRYIGVIGHSSYLYRDLSLEENLLLFARLYKVPEPHKRIREVAAQFHLEKRLEQPVVQLSRGLLQRAALARATLHDPLLLLLDEPFTGLDPTSSDLLQGLIAQWRERERLILFATHDLSRAAQSADRFLILSQGQIAADSQGPLDGSELLDQYNQAIAATPATRRKRKPKAPKTEQA